MRNPTGSEVVVVRGDDVLFVRRALEPNAGLWEMPGGFSELGEHPTDTARREAREELGVEVRLLGVLGFYLDPYLGELVHVTSYLAETDDPIVIDPDEVSEYRWFALDALPPEHEASPGHLDRTRDLRRLRAGETPLALRTD